MSLAVANLAMNAKAESEAAKKAVESLLAEVADLKQRVQKLEQERGQSLQRQGQR